MTEQAMLPTTTAATGTRRAGRYLLGVALRLVVTTWLVATATFVVVRALPGNPVELYIQNLISGGTDPAVARSQASAYLRADLDSPLISQYGRYLVDLLHGNLGASTVIAPGRPVSLLIIDRLPWTLVSVGGALIISFFIGLRLGAAAASHRKSWLDHLITNSATIIDAVPAVLLAVVAVFALAVVFPIVSLDALRGAYSADTHPGWNFSFLASAAGHLVVPGSIYILSSVGGWTLAMRSNCVSVLGDDYVTQAKARGLSARRIRTTYVGRNARLPLVTGFAISLGFVISGSVLVEQVFVYPGIGQLLNNAIGVRDYSVMQGVVIVTTVAVLIATAIADALYGWLDPRVRVGSGGPA